MHSLSAFNARDNGDIRLYPDVTNYLQYCRPYRITYPTFYEQTCDSEFPPTRCFHHIVVVTIPESNAACMRVVCAMHTLHTLKLEFVKRFQTPTAVKFSARMCHTLPQRYYIFIFIRKKQRRARVFYLQ